MAIKKTPWWSRQTKSNDKKKKTERKPWGWRDEPKSKPKQKKESFWDRQDRKMKEVKSKASKETGVEVPNSRPKETAVVERPRNTRKLSKDTVREARNRFFKEMKHEGIKLTSLGKKVEKDNYRKSESSTQYTNRNMKYFSGNKEQEGKYWVRAKKPSKSRRDRRDRRDKRDRRGRRVRRGRRERRDRDEPEPVVESQGGTSVGGESKPRTKDQERRKFFEEMKHEGYELTEEGKRNEKDAYHSAKDADSYRKYVYRMARDEKMYIKVGKSSSTEMEMAAEYCSRDFGTKAGDWFARF